MLCACQDSPPEDYVKMEFALKRVLPGFAFGFGALVLGLMLRSASQH